jgi:DnaJ family protein A protein 2
VVTGVVQIAPGIMTQTQTECRNCQGTGQVYKEKDKCKKCKGKRSVEDKKQVELYIPPGTRNGEHIVLNGEADQPPEFSEPGDLVFGIVELPHKTFIRHNADLKADLHITLAEALTGFDRVVLTHLDGRGISLKVQQPGGRILRPDQLLKVDGEGMPIKKSDARGDLYLLVKVDFPKDGWIKDDAAISKLQSLLPGPAPEIKADVIDEVQYEANVSQGSFGENGDMEGDWEDDEDSGGPQCATQ